MLNRDDVKKFKAELAMLLDKYGLSTACKTLDYVLADYVEKCIQNFHSTIFETLAWNDKKG